jgi:thiol:disulfide interchange protein
MKISYLPLGAAILTSVVFLTAATAAPGQTAAAGKSLFSDGPKADEVVVTVNANFTALAGEAAKEPSRLFVTATINHGWHIYSITQGTGASPTKIDVKWPKGVRPIGTFRPSVAPTITKDADGNKLEAHEGTVTWFVPIVFDSGVNPATLKIPGVFSFGACDAKSCRMPEDLPFTAALGMGVELPEEPGNGDNHGDGDTSTAAPLDLNSLLVQLSLAFLGGLILNVMPCVLPVISLKILAFVQQAGESRGRVFMLNVWYSLGMLFVFMILAALANGVGMAAGHRLSWGQQFTNDPFKITLTALVFVMALSLLGLWEIPIPGFFGSGRANDLQAKEGPVGAFSKGVFTTILATPCSGPFLGPVFGSLLGQPAYVIYGIFGAIGLGMASPYLLIGAFPAAIRFLPRPGAWMETFKQVVGFLTMAAVVYLFSLLQQRYIVPTMTLLLGLAVACWWIGRTQFFDPSRRLTGWLGGTAVAALLGWLAFTVLTVEPKIPWGQFSSAAVAKARAEGKTVMVDFTANWCPNCKWNSKWAIETDAVANLVKSNEVTPLLADWSKPSDDIQQMLNRLRVNSIPCLAIWPAAEPDEKVIKLPDLLTETKVLDALKQAGPSKKGGT